MLANVSRLDHRNLASESTDPVGVVLPRVFVPAGPLVEQLPTLLPDAYDERCPWAKSKKLQDWIADRVLKLTCTADDMRPLAEAAGFKEGVHKWKEDERAQLRAELDAAYFRLYGIARDDTSYILTTFQGIAKEDGAHGGEGPTRRLVMEAYDELQS